MKKLTLGAIALSIALTACNNAQATSSTATKAVAANPVQQTKLATTAQHSPAEVTNGIQLKNALKNIKDGQTLLVKSGTYANIGRVEITASNVTIKAEVPGKAIMTGLFQMDFLGKNSTLSGFRFENGGPVDMNGVVILNGEGNKFEESTIYKFNTYEYKADAKGKYPTTRWVTVSGKNNSVLNNRFEGKYRRGAMLVLVSKEEKDNSMIKGNIFKDITPKDLAEIASNPKMQRSNANDRQAMRLGDSKTSQFTSGATVEDNLFEGINGELELISVKACDITIKGNTFKDSNSMVSLRHGKRNVVENNVILGGTAMKSGGIRFYDEDHIIRNNYVEGTQGYGNMRGGIAVNTGLNDSKNGEILSQEKKGKELNKQWTPKNVIIENNTLVNNRQGILFSNKKHKVSLTDNSKVEVVYPGNNLTFKNNLVIAGSGAEAVSVAILDKALIPTEVTYENNVFSGLKDIVTEGNKGIEVAVPATKKVNGMVEATDTTLGAKNLTILTEETTGTSY